MYLILYQTIIVLSRCIFNSPTTWIDCYMDTECVHTLIFSSIAIVLTAAIFTSRMFDSTEKIAIAITPSPRKLTQTDTFFPRSPFLLLKAVLPQKPGASDPWTSLIHGRRVYLYETKLRRSHLAFLHFTFVPDDKIKLHSTWPI